VTLDGQGADEELAGYHYFFGHFFKELFLGLRWLRLSREIMSYLRIHRSSYGLRSGVFFLLPSFLMTKLRIQENDYLSDAFYEEYSSTSRVSEELYASSSLNQALLDHFEYKLEHLLKWEDGNGMWFSIEARVPFLDHNHVERVLSAPSDQVINKGMTKSMLREALKGVIPERIRRRQDKVGFLTPEDDWFRTAKFRSFILDLLNSTGFRNRGYWKCDKFASLYKDHLDNKINISKEIWKWINLELWFQEFMG
jgi:asparagine synthase (glutamine-hydrolysing)